jgi:hypothetical protein
VAQRDVTNTTPNPNDKDLAFEMVKALEAGMMRHVNNSFVYSPFKLFYKIFTRANPNLMNEVREYVRNDIFDEIYSIPDFNLKQFIYNGRITPKGKKLLRVCFNFGVHLFKKELSVREAFRLVKNHDFRMNVYHHVLDVVRRVTSRVLHYSPAAIN